MSTIIKLLVASLLVLALTAEEPKLQYPGTPNRPILSDDEAARLTPDVFYGDWSDYEIDAQEISKINSGYADYIVAPEGYNGTDSRYTDIQAAVNDAMNSGSTDRQYVKILGGTYHQTVYVEGNVPLTIYGDSVNTEGAQISFDLSADTSVKDYIKKVNTNFRYKEGDAGYSTYAKCAKNDGIIGTFCSSTFVINSDNAHIYNLNVINNGDSQAVALRTNGDKIVLSNLVLNSHQATLYLGSLQSAEEIQRVYVTDCKITGDLDFVVGAATAVFSNTIFNAVSDRHSGGASVFAASTYATNLHGFLAINCEFTGDQHFLDTKTVRLGRALDDEKDKSLRNGQVFLLHCAINKAYDTTEPWLASTTGRPFQADISPDRRILESYLGPNDHYYNRMGDYQSNRL